ncbi:MAG: DUF1579 domain-containing protein [Telluria sp.]
MRARWLWAIAACCTQLAFAQPARDASHAFDFDIGTWRTHSSRLMHPLSGSAEWRDMDGITTVRPVWGGRANLAEYKADGPAAAIELLALRFYDPESGQWSIHFAVPGKGELGTPGVGGLRDGRIEFHDQERFDGRQILVRFAIWSITPDTAQSEQAFSADGGKTWETNWINRYTRVKP